MLARGYGQVGAEATELFAGLEGAAKLHKSAYAAARLGVRPLSLLRPLVVELDPAATDAQLSVVLGL